MALAVAAIVARPLPLVTVLGGTLNVALAADAGTVHVTVTLGTGLPLPSFTRATSDCVNAVPTRVLCPEPLLTVTLAGEPTFTTVSVNAWVALGARPLFAVIVSGKVPVTVAVPESVAVPFPLSTNATPAGSVPVLLIAATGVPVVVTVNVPKTPLVKVALLALVIAGASPTVSDAEAADELSAIGVVTAPVPST